MSVTIANKVAVAYIHRPSGLGDWLRVTDRVGVGLTSRRVMLLGPVQGQRHMPWVSDSGIDGSFPDNMPSGRFPPSTSVMLRLRAEAEQPMRTPASSA